MEHVARLGKDSCTCLDPTLMPPQHLAHILGQGILQPLLLVLQEAAQALQLCCPELRRSSPSCSKSLP